MTAPTLNGLALGNVQSLSNDKNGNIIPLSIPGGDSDVTETIDLLGVIRTITIVGNFTGTTAANKTSVEAIEALCNGLQSSSVNFVSDEIGTISVKVNRMRTEWPVGTPSAIVNYVITLLQGV